MLWTIAARLHSKHFLARELTQHQHCQIQPLSPHPHGLTYFLLTGTRMHCVRVGFFLR